MSRLRLRPKALIEQARHYLQTWESMRPEKEFAGLSLEGFRGLMRPALEARLGLVELECGRHALLLQRNFADRVLLETMKRIAAGVVADAAEGDDGEFYGALGFLTRTERRMGRLTRRSKKEAPGRARARARLRGRTRAARSAPMLLKKEHGDE